MIPYQRHDAKLGVLLVVSILSIFTIGSAHGGRLPSSFNPRSQPFAPGAEDDIRDAYEDVRNDGTETTWAVFNYPDEGKEIAFKESGDDYSEFLALLHDDMRAYAYVRVETGDDLSRRAKFAFITWIGRSVRPLKKAKVSTDKAFVKQIITQFGKEILADEKDELRYERVKTVLEKASGANYGTGA
ncbi:Coactosin-like protein [Desmophyllum pertusum]|uniref:Coactosin-like protein n=1 Tax=Desmophyllum pertusum TaxID=174260 RepID=A0A9W9YT52_9CNID|nr:Coactosin-like protein [Desmophyllum pertusum]